MVGIGEMDLHNREILRLLQGFYQGFYNIKPQSTLLRSVVSVIARPLQRVRGRTKK